MVVDGSELRAALVSELVRGYSGSSRRRIQRLPEKSAMAHPTKVGNAMEQLKTGAIRPDEMTEDDGSDDVATAVDDSLIGNPFGGIKQSGWLIEECATGNLKDEHSAIKLLIAVTSACCTRASRHRRDAIRETWARDARLIHGDVVDVRFVLAWPEKGFDAEMLDSLADEIRQNEGAADMVMLRDVVDIYDNLPEKTLGLIRYMGMSKCEYTHVFKTDDDVYVRVPGLLSDLGYQHSSWHIPTPHPFEQMNKVYTGCIEVKHGFHAVRDPESKYLTHDEWPSGIRPRLYAAGWGYMLSADNAFYVLGRMTFYNDNPAERPKYYKGLLKLEDVMVGYILSELHRTPQYHSGFKTAWQSCGNYTVVKHMDIDAPFLMPAVSIQDRVGLWDMRTIQCSSALTRYWEWKEFSDSHKAERVQILMNQTSAETVTYHMPLHGHV